MACARPVLISMDKPEQEENPVQGLALSIVVGLGIWGVLILILIYSWNRIG